MKAKNTRLNFKDLVTDRTVYIADAKRVYPAHVITRYNVTLEHYNMQFVDQLQLKDALALGYHLTDSGLITEIVAEKTGKEKLTAVAISQFGHTNRVLIIVNNDGGYESYTMDEYDIDYDHTSMRIFSKKKQAIRWHERIKSNQTLDDFEETATFVSNIIIAEDGRYCPATKEDAEEVLADNRMVFETAGVVM